MRSLVKADGQGTVAVSAPLHLSPQIRSQRICFHLISVCCLVECRLEPEQRPRQARWQGKLNCRTVQFCSQDFALSNSLREPLSPVTLPADGTKECIATCGSWAVAVRHCTSVQSVLQVLPCREIATAAVRPPGWQFLLQTNT